MIYKIDQFLKWLEDNTDFDDWHPNVKLKVRNELIRLFENCIEEPRTAADSLD